MDTEETSVYFYLILAGVIIGIIIFYFIISLFRQQKRYRTLNTEKIDIELNTLEAERKRIAGDLHDDLGPVLSSAKNILQSMENLTPGDLKLHTEGIGYIDSSITRMRQIARSLMPNSLVRKGLAFAIQEFIDFSPKKELIVTFTHGDLPTLPEHAAIQVYRIMQEIIHNTIKHAKAKKLTIQIQIKDKCLIIQTADNGCGYDQEKNRSKANGLGLQIMESRVGMLKGEMNISSGKKEGTRYFISIPLV